MIARRLELRVVEDRAAHRRLLAATFRARPVRHRLTTVADGEQAGAFSCGGPALGGRRRLVGMLDFALGDAKNEREARASPLRRRAVDRERLSHG